jgi:hypothetical protein
MSTITSASKIAIRHALRAMFGARRYRITRDGEIHAYGTMPNSNITGWWLFAQTVNDAIHCAA